MSDDHYTRLQDKVSERLDESAWVFEVFNRAVTLVTWISFNVIALLTLLETGIVRRPFAYWKILVAGGAALFSVISCVMLIVAFHRTAAAVIDLLTGRKVGQLSAALSFGFVALTVFITISLIVQAAEALGIQTNIMRALRG